MRFTILCAVLFLASCDDDVAVYADGTPWEPAVPLLKNDSLRLHPYLRRYPTNDQEWTRFIQTLNVQTVGFIKTYAPTNYTGFSSDPSAVNYIVTVSDLVILWGVDLGISDDTGFTFDIPEEIWPSQSTEAIVTAMDNGTPCAASAEISAAGQITMKISSVSGTIVRFSSTGWTNSGNKGLEGTLIYRL